MAKVFIVVLRLFCALLVVFPSLSYAFEVGTLTTLSKQGVPFKGSFFIEFDQSDRISSTESFSIGSANKNVYLNAGIAYPVYFENCVYVKQSISPSPENSSPQKYRLPVVIQCFQNFVAVKSDLIISITANNQQQHFSYVVDLSQKPENAQAEEPPAPQPQLTEVTEPTPPPTQPAAPVEDSQEKSFQTIPGDTWVNVSQTIKVAFYRNDPNISNAQIMHAVYAKNSAAFSGKELKSNVYLIIPTADKVNENSEQSSLAFLRSFGLSDSEIRNEKNTGGKVSLAKSSDKKLGATDLLGSYKIEQKKSAEKLASYLKRESDLNETIALKQRSLANMQSEIKKERATEGFFTRIMKAMIDNVWLMLLFFLFLTLVVTGLFYFFRRNNAESFTGSFSPVIGTDYSDYKKVDPIELANSYIESGDINRAKDVLQNAVDNSSTDSIRAKRILRSLEES